VWVSLDTPVCNSRVFFSFLGEEEEEEEEEE
jgi:hypothetical protein